MLAARCPRCSSEFYSSAIENLRICAECQHGMVLIDSQNRAGRGARREPIARPQVCSQVASSAGRVLVVEDNVDLQEALGFILQTRGYRVGSAYDGMDGLQKVVTFSPDVILLDLMLPQMDGAEFARELTGRGLRPAIPIVLMTGCADAVETAAAIGAVGCVSKPFETPDLLGQLARAIGHS